MSLGKIQQIEVQFLRPCLTSQSWPGKFSTLLPHPTKFWDYMTITGGYWTHRFKPLPGWHSMGKCDKDLLRGLSTFKNSYRSCKVPLFTTAKSHRAHMEINQLSFNLLNVWKERCDSGIPQARPQSKSIRYFCPYPVLWVLSQNNNNKNAVSGNPAKLQRYICRLTLKCATPTIRIQLYM